MKYDKVDHDDYKGDCDDKYNKVYFDYGKHEDESDLRRNDQVYNDPQPVVAVCHVLKMKINPIIVCLSWSKEEEKQ